MFSQVHHRSGPDRIRVAITGLGLCTPLGPDRESTWSRLVAGERGLRWIDLERRWAGGPARSPSLLDPHRRVAALAELVADEAIRDSRLSWSEIAAERLGCVFGTSKGELQTLLEADLSSSPATPWLECWPSAAAMRLANRFRCHGPVLAPVAACATGLVACLRGAELIQQGDCDVVLAGSADASLFPAVIGSFRRLGVLAHIADDPGTACRPFDRRRSGFLIGEGAACLVLERYDLARQRGATIYGEWLSGRLGSDPSGLTQVDESGQALSRVMADVVADCGRQPEFVQLHGTATRSNDFAECRAVQTVFGGRTENISCAAWKGSLGHLLGAAGSVELALTVLSLRDQLIPPTVNLCEPDPECPLKLIAGSAVKRPIQTALKISSGFGGHLAVAAVGRADSI